ncbi:UvrABC system protein C [Fibrobacterales bacterium]|nr:UvrABC system protein C [Fibrobacterales bacterium]
MSLESRLAELPARPGVYLMKNEKGEIIYIGKAKLLNKRVRSYFDGREKNGHRAAQLMLPHICDIEWIITESEAEALILEANLITKHFPFYNVRQKDDKHFPYLMLTMQEQFPRLRITRHSGNDKNLYFGPFVSSHYMRLLLDLIPQLFKLRECKLKFPLTPNLARKINPCLNFHIGRCEAPCVKMVSEEVYLKGVREAKLLLEGKRDDILAEWEKDMKAAAAEMRFEDATKIRDRIKAVQASFAKQNADVANTELSLDVVAIVRAKKDGDSSISVATVVIIEYRNGVIFDRRHFHLESRLEHSESEILGEFLPQWYLSVPKENLPREIALEYLLGDVQNGLGTDSDEEISEELPQTLSHKTSSSEPAIENDEQQAFEEFLSKLAGRRVLVGVPLRGDKIGYLRIARANAEMLLVELQAKAAKYDEMNNSIFELQRQLKLQNPPYCFECFDISHLGGTEPVASMIRFVNGKPSKSEYRKYKVKIAVGGDDFGSMHEILTRRLTRLLSENAKLPDLLVMDGGKGQVDVAFSVLEELNLTDIPVIGLAKRLEEIVFPREKPSILLKRNNPALQLLQRARDEAHRFAINFQRERRKKTLR